MIARALTFARNRQSLRRRLTGGPTWVAVMAVLTIGIAAISLVPEIESRARHDRRQETAAAVQIVERYPARTPGRLDLPGTLDSADLQTHPQAVIDLPNDGPALDDVGRVAPGYIFGPFRQVKGVAAESRAGIGPGLSRVRQWVGLAGGEIHLQSREGMGTTLAVSLPLAPRTGGTA